MSRSVEVRTYSRLHFGLSSLGHNPSDPQFGGVGVMVDASEIELQITPDRKFNVAGPLAARAREFAETAAEQWQLPALPEVAIEIRSAPREHVGLGVGTQLALSIAAGLGEALGLPWRDPWRLAQLTRRGRRSAVGTYGFLKGGLIVDGGHRQGEALGRLGDRVDFPADWRFVLFVPKTQTGCAGSAEERAFSQLPPVPREITHELESIAVAELVPAARAHDFGVFSEALYRYGSLAGKCFAAVQGGTFCSPQTAALIEWVRGQGIAGVGQSSWGPTVFALAIDQTSATRLAERFMARLTSTEYDVLIAPAANQGAIVIDAESVTESHESVS